MIPEGFLTIYREIMEQGKVYEVKILNMALKNGQQALLREFKESDFGAIHELNKEEGWTNLVENREDTIEAWKHSNIAYVALIDGQIIGYVRGFTDRYITLFICELLIQKEYRGMGLGKEILSLVHNLYPKTRIDLLASSTSRSYYEAIGYRAFYGFRKTIAKY